MSAYLFLLLVVAQAPAVPESNAAAPLKSHSERGPVQARLELSPSEPTIGDPLKLVLEVTSEPGVEVIMPEFRDSLDAYRVVDFAESERLDENGWTVSAQSYTLGAPLSGRHSVPPFLIEFLDRRPDKKLKPDGEPAYELLTDRLDFKVRSLLPEEITGELAPPRGELEPLPPPVPPRWPWILGAAMLVIVLSPIAWRAWSNYRRRVRMRSAYDIAVGRMESLLARGLPDTEDQVDGFFVELTTITRRYLEDRFVLRAPELTTEEFAELVTGSSILTRPHQSLLQDFLRQADLVKFAHVIPGAGQIQDAADMARRFLDETRENAPLLDIEGEPDPASVGKEGADAAVG